MTSINLILVNWLYSISRLLYEIHLAYFNFFFVILTYLNLLGYLSHIISLDNNFH